MWITAHFPGPPFVSIGARFKPGGSAGYGLISERWRRDEYWHYRGRSPMPPVLTAQERADLYCSSHPGIDAGGE